MKPIISMLSVFFVATVAFGSDVYTWEDDNGIMHFSDNPSDAPVKRQKRNFEPVVIMGNTNNAKAKEGIFGVFSNNKDGFSGVQLIVRENGQAFWGGGVAGIVGDWSYDKENSILSIICYDWEADKDFSIKFKFNQNHRFYLPMDDSNSRPQRLQFVSNEISKQIDQVFKEYPEKIKEVREKKAKAKRR